MKKYLAPALLVGVGMALGMSVRADNNPATSNVPHRIPYAGTIDVNGQPFGGTEARLRFRLYKSADPAAVHAWEQGFGLGGGLPVPVQRGRYSVVLGGSGPESLDNVIFDAETLFLGVELQDPVTNQVVALSGRQQLFPAAWSLWTERANTFTAAGNISGGGSLSITGTASLGGTTTTLGNSMASALLRWAQGSDFWTLGPNASGDMELRRTAGNNAPYMRVRSTGDMEFFPGGASTTITFRTDGTIVQAACPSGMVRLGDSCIDVAINPAATYTQAIATCHNESAHICRLDELQACDSLGGAIASDCATQTDSSAFIAFWTSTSAREVNDVDDSFSEVACYLPNLPGFGSNVVTSCDGSGSSANGYWCCRNAR